MRPGGRLVITGVTSGAQTDMDLSILQGRPLTLMGSGGRTRRSFGEMMSVINRGELHGVVGRVFPLQDVAEAPQGDGRPGFLRKAGDTGTWRIAPVPGYTVSAKPIVRNRPARMTMQTGRGMKAPLERLRTPTKRLRHA